MKSSTSLVKRTLLFLTGITLFSISCKKDNTPSGPFVAVASAATDVEVFSFVANWQKTNGASNYDLFVATDSNFSQPLGNYNPATVSGISTTVTGLDSNTTYYYKVVAVNSHGTKSSPSNTISLMTGSTTADRFIFIGSEDGNFYCLDARNGAKVWSFNGGGDLESSATVSN